MTHTLIQWLMARLGEKIDVDGFYGPQCVDAINDYLAYCRSTPRVRGNAIDISAQAIKGMVWTPNLPANSPPPGSIVVWRGGDSQLGLGPEGHVAVAIWCDRWGLVVAEQNWGGHTELRLNSHGYRSVAGWHSPDANP